MKLPTAHPFAIAMLAIVAVSFAQTQTVVAPHPNGKDSIVMPSGEPMRFITVPKEVADRIAARVTITTRSDVLISSGGNTIIQITGLPRSASDPALMRFTRPAKPEDVAVELTTQDGTAWVARWEKKP